MLWYLLYPLRGTSQPPRLSSTHPIRRAFYRHGKLTAQHWLIAMLTSVALAMALAFPPIFLAEHPTAGFAAYPHHHVWTSAKPFAGDPVRIDVEMRQVWVHGSYMGALEKGVLRSGLRIQEVLVGGEEMGGGLAGLGGGERIEEDEDLLTTINAQSRTSSSLNVALRPASVFAGKMFDRRHLKAADALVLTFMNKVESLGIGGKWQDRMKSVKAIACENCTLFPFDGDVTRNRVYEFSFMPVSLQENLALAFAYGCMALYVLLSLRRLKAFHSRFGLVVTAITQMTFSVLASFTICGILKINLSMIPQNAYPFVVLVIGLENMFRLINAVLAYPATMATDQRIANALGDVGPVSVATAAQNLIILSLLATFVSPGVAAFCIFACIATLFDAFLLLTFFVAVLNVDIRRLELQDALARSNQHKRKASRKPSPAQHKQKTWFGALVQGRLPFSTRMAGTAVTTTFILSLNYHFFERHEERTGLRHLLGLSRGGPKNTAEFDTFTPPPMNATLTPGEWMRMQDFDTAREVMRLAKPGADSFVIRVFAPLIVVLSGADRTGAPLGTEAWTQALAGFARYHFYPVAVAVVFAVAFVAVLMNFLLYSEAGEEEGVEDERFEEALTVQAVTLPHRLDIVKLFGVEKGHLVSVALDRTIAVSVLDRVQSSYTVWMVPMEVLSMLAWPIRTAIIDDGGDWLACHCADDRIVFYHHGMGTTVSETLQYPDDNPAVLFRFLQLPDGDGTSLRFVILTSGGRLVSKKIGAEAPVSNTRISEVPILGAKAITIKTAFKFFVVTEEARIIGFQWSGGTLSESISQLLPVDTIHGRLSGAIEIRMQPELDSDMLLVVTSHASFILDVGTLTTICKLGQAPCPGSQVILGPTASCPTCGSIALISLAFAESGGEGREFSMRTESFDGDDGAPLCLRSSLPSCQKQDRSRSTAHDLSEDSGEWVALPAHAIVGLRRKPKQSNDSNDKDARSPTQGRPLRRSNRTPNQRTCEDGWQAYKLAIDGGIETVDMPVAPSDTSDGSQLYVNKAGPALLLDAHSAAVAFGNTVQVIRAPRRGTMISRSNGQPLDRHGSSSRRRLTLRKAQ
ncbi:hypothetical protein LTR35_012659 [Friedmanniomyces endolithicus]|uniref:SSD domain-containing protein n=1 Tax=Friedmanniomyces endolithicus TaxID=329885 RepID=A0AAN6FUU2_9PEZI|nr:hypothetical protein LTS00_017107 [Friedmanniomyces endolithicus]KAK0272693.1 hypothetical protein LTR35_012659 [Friedmanniomyces endolithicus]KAK0323645.1 hypothetical protein LTR82_005392 [Friedmanniomyces endolithicus]KAK1006375.1 hypothetical protein LTR54_006899 [Friedmanniomyces endolithicus]